MVVRIRVRVRVRVRVRACVEIWTFKRPPTGGSQATVGPRSWYQ